MNWRRAGVAGIRPRQPAPPPEEDFLATMNDDEKRLLLDAARLVRDGLVHEAARSVLFGQPGVRHAGPLALAVYELQQKVAELGQPSVDTDAVVSGVVDAITEQGLAGAVADELARRLARSQA
jgi:hypothetical protein